MFCKCNQPRKCYPLKDWRVIRYQYTPHGYSRVKCLNAVACGLHGQIMLNKRPIKTGKKDFFYYEKSNIERQQRK